MGELGVNASVLIAVILSALTVLYAILWLRGEKHAHLIAGLPMRSHPFKELYLAGIEFLSLIHYRYETAYDRRLEKRIRLLQGKQYAEYYRRINMAQKIGIGIPAFLLLGAASVVLNEKLLLGFAAVGSLGTAYYFDASISEAVSKREERIRRDFPEVLTKLTLLANAGMVMREAWRQTAESGAGVLYEEMRRTSDLVENGVSESEAYLEFASRCGEPVIDKVISALVQNLSKGSRETVDFLRRTSSDCWNERKHAVRRKGEEASAKMLVPIGLMFVGILLMTILPMMANMTF